jgi:hypothetical protein
MSRRKAARPLSPEVPPLSPLPPPAEPLTSRWKWILAAVIAVSIGLSIAHMQVTPVLPPNTGSLINAPDEPAHVGYVKILADERRLPDREDSGVTYEWHQPPLYYALALPLYGGGARAMRWVSLLCGLGSLALIFLAVRKVFRNDAPLAVFATGIAALLPMREAVYAAVGNDALVELLFSAVLYQIVLAFTNGFTARRAAYIGMIVGAALLTKANGVILLPIVAAAGYFLWRGGEAPAAVGRNMVYVLSFAFCLSFLWFQRNVRLYHELTPLNAFMREFEGTSKAKDWIGSPQSVDPWTGEIEVGGPMDRPSYLALVANWTFRTAFAAFTPLRLAAAGIPRFMRPPTFYVPYLGLLVAALAGLTRLHFRRHSELTDAQISIVRLFILTGALVAISFAGFVWTFFQAQGRYLYPAMLPGSALIALSTRSLIPARYRDAGTLAILALMALHAIAFLVVGVLPAYP